MNKGVEILLARMESNPDEFTLSDRWNWVMNDVWTRMYETSLPLDKPLYYLTDEEVKALYDGLIKLRAENFTRKVMAQVLDIDERGEQMELFSTTSRFSR